MTNRHDRFIWFFMRNLGGVAAVVRRIILRQKGIFTWQTIHAEFVTKYPGITPADTQILDVIDQMKTQQEIECVIESENGNIYQRCSRPASLSMFHPKQRQMEF